MFSLAIYDTLTAGLADRRRRSSPAPADRRRRHGRPDRRHPAEDRRCPRGRRRAVPGAGRQLRRRLRGARNGDMRLVRATPCTTRVEAHRGLGRGPGRDLPSCEETSDGLTDSRRSTSTRRSRPPCSRSSRTSPTAAGTSRPGSTRWSTPPGWSRASRRWPRRWASTTLRAQGSLTPVEQDQLPAGPRARGGAGVDRAGPPTSPAAPPSSSGWCCRRRPTPRSPTTRPRAEEFAREHPDRQEVRIVAGATRAGATYCALRLRAHDDDQSVVGGRRPGARAAAAAGHATLDDDRRRGGRDQ